MSFPIFYKANCSVILSKSKFKGYRVIAVDGLKGELPNTPELRSKYKLSKTNRYPQFHAVASFDVLNCKFIDAEFEMCTTDERAAAYKLLENHQKEDDIFLFDRGFPSIALIQKLNDNGFKFIARVSKSFIGEVDNFISQKSLDKTIHIDYTVRRAATCRVKNVRLPYSFDLRCVKIKLNSNETEVLITNLPNDTFKRKDLGNLYALRWGIETGFNHLKNAINIEEFVGIKENSIKQEFYSILIKYNLIMQYIDEAELVAHCSKKTLKLEYKVNVCKATTVVISQIATMLFANNTKLNALINKIVDFIKNFRLPIRKDRSFKRCFNSAKPK